MGKSNKGLKAALSSQQNRLKVKEKLAQASKLREQRQKPRAAKLSIPEHEIGSSEKVTAGSRHPPTMPFKSTDKILLIGEGNFSFTRALIQDPPAGLSYLPRENIIATVYDTEKECYEKYPESQSIVKLLQEQGVEVLFGIDATRLEKYSALKAKKFDRVVWNFPHAGKGITDQDRNILSNQRLLLDFLRSAAPLLRLGRAPVAHSPNKGKRTANEATDFDDASASDEEIAMVPSNQLACRGTILVTLRNVAPYTQWDLPRLAKKPPPPSGSTSPNPCYTLLRSFRFHRSLWKGYEHRMTKGERAHGKGTTGEGGEDRTWEFYLRDECST